MAKGATWVGPVLGAMVLIGGYVAYDQWRSANERDKECAALKRSFLGNMNRMAGPADQAIADAKRQRSLAPMESLAGSVAANKVVMDTLDDQCPGWVTKQYRN